MTEPTGPRPEPTRRRSPGHRRPLPKADRLARGHSARLHRLREALRARLRKEIERGLLPAPDLDATDADRPEEPLEREPAPDDADLPEHTLYRDTGCHKWPACLTCPLPRCIYDRPIEKEREFRQRRDRAIRALYRRGWTTDRIAQRFGLSLPQVRRIRGPRNRAGSE